MAFAPEFRISNCRRCPRRVVRPACVPHHALHGWSSGSLCSGVRSAAPRIVQCVELPVCLVSFSCAARCLRASVTTVSFCKPDIRTAPIHTYFHHWTLSIENSFYMFRDPQLVDDAVPAHPTTLDTSPIFVQVSQLTRQQLSVSGASACGRSW